MAEHVKNDVFDVWVGCEQSSPFLLLPTLPLIFWANYWLPFENIPPVCGILFVQL